jgi:hypothetical protein
VETISCNSKSNLSASCVPFMTRIDQTFTDRSGGEQIGRPAFFLFQLSAFRVRHPCHPTTYGNICKLPFHHRPIRETPWGSLRHLSLQRDWWLTAGYGKGWKSVVGDFVCAKGRNVAFLQPHAAVGLLLQELSTFCSTFPYVEPSRTLNY